mgnify:CR=1 FL=1
MSLIPPEYLFSQHSLRTFVRCPRRFLLKYVDRQPWPAPARDDDPAYRAHLEAGRVFHEWIARALLGIPAERHDTAIYPGLDLWWQTWQGVDLSALPTVSREVELPLVVPLGGHRLYARFDLLAVGDQGEAVIVDWKTLERVPSIVVMQQALQTRVYQYALVAAGQVVTGSAPLLPERVRMVYWFADSGAQLELGYSAAAHRQNRDYLLALMDRIAGATREEMIRTDDVAQCAGCGYRTLCERETVKAQADSASWLAEDLDFELDQVPEVEF